MNEIDEALERLALPVAVVGPERLVAGLGAVEEEESEEILEPARGLEERVAFEIEDDVAG